MMRNIVKVVLSVALVLSLSACGSSDVPETQSVSEVSERAEAVAEEGSSDAATGSAAEDTAEDTAIDTAEAETLPAETVPPGIAKEELKVGFVFYGDESDGYTAAHYAGAMAMKTALGLQDDQILVRWNVAEDEICYDTAAELVNEGCQIIFGNSLGYEPYLQQAAAEFPNVEFCHAAGSQAGVSGLTNLHNYFASVQEARYVSGVVAGMKLQEMVDAGTITAEAARIGYVGAFSNEEVISGFTAFYLGARSVCPSSVMEVTYINSWANEDLEKEAAEALIADQCILISQHGNTSGAAAACEAAGVPFVGYNISMTEAAPRWALTSAVINWAPYVTDAVQRVLDGVPIDTDWCRGYQDGVVGITGLNEGIIAAGTADKVKEVEAALTSGTLNVFDTSAWTVGGKTLDTYEIDGVEYITDGYFQESVHRSAPSLDFLIDGITDLTK